MNYILSRLIFTHILYPSSKLASNRSSKMFIEQPTFNLHDIYRSLSVLAKESDFIQSELYKNSQRILPRRNDILYYDCTNYYFEIEQEDELRKYGKSKQHQQLPIVGMVMKTEFSARPIYLQREDRIKAHFITCFASLAVFSILEKKLGEQHTCDEIINVLRSMMMYRPGEKLGYLPTYTRTAITDALHEAFGFRTDYEILTDLSMKKVFRESKKVGSSGYTFVN